MRVHAHTKFCFLCVLTLLFHQCAHCHESGHHHHDDRRVSATPRTGPANRSAPGADAGAAEHEQQYYILQLFQRYGHQDRLDFKGFQDLLLNLGLGEVRVVELEHDELGHDHVAHLDLLEVQEGKHWHSAGHPHAHAKHHDHHHTRGDTNGSMCSPKPGVEKDHDHGSDHDHNHGDGHDHNHEHGSDHDQDHGDGHDHNQDHGSDHVQDHGDGHDHDHGKDHDHGSDHDHDHGDGHDQDHDHGSDHDHDHGDSHDQDHDHGSDHDYLHHHEQLKTQAQVVEHHHDPSHNQDRSHDHSHDPNPVDHPPEHNDLGPGDDADAPPQTRTHRHDHHHHKTPHPHDHHRPPTRPTRASSQPSGSARPSTKRARRPSKGRARDQTRKPNNPTSGPDVDGGADGPERDRDEHAHARARKGKREVPAGATGPNDSPPSGRLDSMSDQHEECLNLTQLFHHYGLSPDSVVSPAQFTYLCPALLYQIDSRVCIRHYHQVDVEEAQQLSGWVWLWSFIAITLISLLSLLGVVLVPILNQSCFKFLLTFLVALAVGTLSGDALLHLLPHSQADHDHGEHADADAHAHVDWLTKFDGVWKGLTALAGIYLLFIIEHCIRMFKHFKDRGGGVCRSKRTGDDGTVGRKLSDHNLNRHSAAERIQLSRFDDPSHTDTQMTELRPPDSPGGAPLAITVSEDGRKKAKKKGHGHAHHCHSEKDMQDAGITSIAWMVIMGDGMHNFSDGLAIGAAFSASVTGGISTSVAVFCHELPHELGDFAVLLKAGMTVKQAIVYNLLSALMAYFGMVIGTALGQYAHNVTSWIFAVTAGMFLYVALVDMLPEMLHGDSEDQKHCNLGHFVLQNVGMLSGFAIMLLIAIFEDRIVLDLGF